MRKTHKFVDTIRLIARQVADFKEPIVTAVSRKNDPFQVLISCILSLRTKDAVTAEASRRLFAQAHTPEVMRKLTRARLQRLIYPVGFYRTKAKVILGLSKRLISEFKGRVPCNREELLSFKGVGRKTANLVLGLGCGIPAICVDTHVHQISNRLGWVRTKGPYETEEALERLIPRTRWIELNNIMVTFGQNICVPVSPFCSRCAVRKMCRRVGVTRWR